MKLIKTHCVGVECKNVFLPTKTHLKHHGKFCETCDSYRTLHRRAQERVRQLPPEEDPLSFEEKLYTEFAEKVRQELKM